MQYIFHFNISDPDINIVVDKDNPNEELKDIITKSESIFIPTIKLEKKGYFFSGWTEDWVYGFEPGEPFHSKHENTTLQPVFGLLSDKNTYTLEYIVEFEGEIFDISEILPNRKYCKNRIVLTSLLDYFQEKASHRGWTDGKNTFVQGQKLVMPEHNVTLYAMYFYYRKLTYSTGDVDGVTGDKYNVQVMRAGGVMDLAEPSRLVRKGYNMVAWHCENDGIDYPFFYGYIMPDEDVIMTAVWKPIIYTVVFKTGVNSIPNIKIRGETKSIIIAPNLETKREGYTFRGWKMSEELIYYPGDEIIVQPDFAGLGISLNAIWALN